VSHRPDAVVIGAGVVGLASAWRLAQRGAQVTVVDPAVGSGASGVAAGMLAPVTEARMGEDALLRLNLASWRLWPDFAAEVEAATGADIGYRADGTLVVGFDADDRVALGDTVARHREMGLDTEMVRGRDLRRLEPGLSPAVRAAALAPGERSVDPQALVGALRTVAEGAGARVVAAAVERVLTDHVTGRVTGVQVAEGAVQADTVVLAAGTDSGRVAGLPPAVRPPVRPVKGQVVVLRQQVADPLLGRTLRGIVHGSLIYLVPRRDGRVVIGATSEEKGWDTTVTGGGVHDLLRDALALVPGLDDAELVGARAGLRPGSPDDLPMIGRSSLAGLVVATGHHRNGILLAPVTADAVAAAVAGDPLPDEVVVCDPDRFAQVAQ
jgi:glycine oxidase